MEARTATISTQTAALIDCLNDARSLRQKTAKAVHSYLTMKEHDDLGSTDSEIFQKFFEDENKIFDDLEDIITQSIKQCVNANLQDASDNDQAVMKI